MTLERAYSVPDSVVTREVEGELVLLDLESGIYFGLDAIGVRIWRLIEDGNSLSAVIEAMLAEFDVEREVLERDLLELVGTLESRGLVTAGD